jgi:hypothetical protein
LTGLTVTSPIVGDVSGNVSGSAATVTTAAQPNITSVGTLTGLTVTGKAIFSSDVSFNGTRIDICGNLFAQYPANSIPQSAIIGGVGSNVFAADVSMNAGLKVAGATTLSSTLAVVNHVTINPITVDTSYNAIRNTGEYLKITIPQSMTTLKYFCTAHSNMIKDFTIAAYSASETDKTYYVTVDAGAADPYYYFSATNGGSAINSSSTNLTLYPGNTYTFIKADTNTSHPFAIGSSHNTTTGIKVQSTGTGASVSSAYTNPYPLHVNGMANIENNLNVARNLTVSGTSTMTSMAVSGTSTLSSLSVGAITATGNITMTSKFIKQF